MLTKMTDADWITVLRVFEASRSRRGDKARDDKNSYQQCAVQFGRGRGAGRESGFPVYFQLKATTRWNMTTQRSSTIWRARHTMLSFRAIAKRYPAF